MVTPHGRPKITLAFPHLQTGKCGRGELGRWGPNQAMDTIVTRRRFNLHTTLDGQQLSGLQVAVVFREDHQRWALPGKFATRELVDQTAKLAEGTKLTGELPSVESCDDRDRAHLAVRRIFELEGITQEMSLKYKDLLDEIFKKTHVSLVCE